VGVEIPGFDLSNQFSDLTMSLLFIDRIHRMIFKKHKKFKLFKYSINKIRTRVKFITAWCVANLTTHTIYKEVSAEV
jgi:hypothetical protein